MIFRKNRWWQEMLGQAIIIESVNFKQIIEMDYSLAMNPYSIRPTWQNGQFSQLAMSMKKLWMSNGEINLKIIIILIVILHI